jgi:hypothetical protein
MSFCAHSPSPALLPDEPEAKHIFSFSCDADLKKKQTGFSKGLVELLAPIEVCSVYYFWDKSIFGVSNTPCTMRRTHLQRNPSAVHRYVLDQLCCSHLGRDRRS